MFYYDKTAILDQVEAPDSVKIYKDTSVVRCRLGKECTIGDRSRLKECSIGDNAIIQRDNVIFNTVIGRYTSTMHNTTIFESRIGAFCAISWGVSIGGAEHNYRGATIHGFISCTDFGFIDSDVQGFDLYQDLSSIGNDVWIAAGACINRGVTIHDGAVIGANSVVTRDVEPYTVVAGSPARPIRKRYCDDWIRRMLALKWWDLPEEMIKDNLDLFIGDLNGHKLEKLELLCGANR